jgi:hypothetical protein
MVFRSTSDAEHIRQTLVQNSDTTVITTRDEETILYNLKAESEAIAAWTNCINGGGLRARFIPQNDDPSRTEVMLQIDYDRAGGTGIVHQF